MSNVGVGVAGCPSLFGIHPHLHPIYDHYIIHQTNSVCCASHRAANHAQDTTLYKNREVYSFTTHSHYLSVRPIALD